MSGSLAPIALFAYKRPEHVSRVLEALRLNPESSDTDLIAFVDGPKHPHEYAAVDAVCRTIENASGFKSLTLRRSPMNHGLSRSITRGISDVLQEYAKIIVIEDDIVVAEGFLEFMNAGLETYVMDEKVASIHGYTYPSRHRLPETFFIRGADCWGWATWGRAWKVFRESGEELLADLLASDGIHEFNFDGAFRFDDMLRDQIAGRNDSWAIRWYASTFLANMLTLYPTQSLVRNIGLDGSGAHCGETSVFDSELHEGRVNVTRIDISESPEARLAFSEFLIGLNQSQGGEALRFLNRLRNLFLKRSDVL